MFFAESTQYWFQPHISIALAQAVDIRSSLASEGIAK